MKVKISRAFIVKQTGNCAGGLAYFDQRSPGSAVWEADWTAKEWLRIIREAPTFVRFLRVKRIIPVNANFSGADLRGETLTTDDAARFEAEGIDWSGALYDGPLPTGWSIYNGRLVRS